MAAEIDGEARALALTALAAGESVSAAARAAGYTRQHLHRLLKTNGFQAELAAKRDEVLGIRTATGGPSEAELVRLEKFALAKLEKIAKGKVRLPPTPGAEGDQGPQRMRLGIDRAKVQAAAAQALLRHVIACRGRAPRTNSLKVKGVQGADGSREVEVLGKGDEGVLGQVAELMKRL